MTDEQNGDLSRALRPGAEPGRPAALGLRLDGGLTNRNYKVTPRRHVLARVSARRRALPSTGTTEHRNTGAAAAGAGPPVIDYRPGLGHPGHRLRRRPDADRRRLRTPGIMARVARRLPPTARRRSLRQRLRHVRHPATLPRRVRAADSDCQPDTPGVPRFDGDRHALAARPAPRCRVTTTCWRATSSTTATASG